MSTHISAALRSTTQGAKVPQHTVHSAARQRYLHPQRAWAQIKSRIHPQLESLTPPRAGPHPNLIGETRQPNPCQPGRPTSTFI